jgi:hypothetical protein
VETPPTGVIDFRTVHVRPSGVDPPLGYCGERVRWPYGNPNPVKQAYTCQTCGEPRPPYQFYCDRHLEDGEKNDKPLLIDRLMKHVLGRS